MIYYSRCARTVTTYSSEKSRGWFDEIRNQIEVFTYGEPII